MKNDLRIDFAKNEIIMSRQFEKCASIAGSEEYRRLQLVRQDYPTFTVVRRSIKKAPSKQAYAGLTYTYMENYIATHVLSYRSEPKNEYSFFQKYKKLAKIILGWL